jgi:putative endonuclease
MTIARQRLGRAAEELVARRLQRAGWRIVARNSRTATGELDLIALDGSTLVFVEVKAGRVGTSVGPERPALAVGRRKQIKIRRLAREWLASADGPRPPWVDGYRFDVVGVSYEGARAVEVEHLRDAF